MIENDICDQFFVHESDFLHLRSEFQGLAVQLFTPMSRIAGQMLLNVQERRAAAPNWAQERSLLD